MKHILIALVLIISATWGYAESRTIGVYVAPFSNAEVRVTIISDVQSENRNDLTVSQACAILGNTQSWGSTIFVGIIAHQVPLRSYLPILQTISDAAGLELVLLEDDGPSFIRDNIKNSVEQGVPGYRRQSAPQPEP